MEERIGTETKPPLSPAPYALRLSKIPLNFAGRE